MDRREQRFKKRTAVTKEQALDFPCANDAADQNHGVPRCRETATGSRSPAGPRRLGTATRMSASPFRRLSAFSGSTPDQGQKAAKFAVLIPGHAGFPNRAKRSEGSDTTPTQNTTCFAVCALVCDLVGEAECVPTFAHKSKRGPFVREVENRDEKRFETALRRQLFCAIRGSDFRGKTELFKPDFWTVKAVR